MGTRGIIFFSSDNFTYHSFAPTAWYENHDYIIFIFFMYNFTNCFFFYQNLFCILRFVWDLEDKVRTLVKCQINGENIARVT